MPRILIIEDSQFQMKNICSILKNDQYELIEASNGLEGLKAIEENPPDAILMDLLMPGMDGFEFIKTLNEKGLKFPITVMTADIQDTTKNECLEMGVFDILNKPVKEGELLDGVKKMLAGLKG